MTTGTRPPRLRSRVVLEYLHSFTTEHGYPPSMRQIGAACGYASSSSVAHQLGVLEASGWIRRDPRSPRAITLLHPLTEETPMQHLHVVTTGATSETVVALSRESLRVVRDALTVGIEGAEDHASDAALTEVGNLLQHLDTLLKAAS